MLVVSFWIALALWTGSMVYAAAELVATARESSRHQHLAATFVPDNHAMEQLS